MSGQLSEKDVNLAAIRAGTTAEDNQVRHGDLLLEFAEAIVTADPTHIASNRDSLVDAVGEMTMIDAAGVASNFQRMVRIADSTGIPLGDTLEGFSSEVRADLALDEFLLLKK